MKELATIMLLNVVLLVLFAEYGLTAEGAHIPSFAGPVRLQVMQAGPCPDDKLGKNVFRFDNCMIRQTREKVGPRLYCTMENLEPLNDLNQATISMASWSRVSGWAENAFIIPVPKLCSGLKLISKEGYEKLEGYAKDGEKLCPRLPGNFTVDGCPAHFTFNSAILSMFPYGRYRSHGFILKNGTTLGCLRLVIDAVPLIQGRN